VAVGCGAWWALEGEGSHIHWDGRRHVLSSPCIVTIVAIDCGAWRALEGEGSHWHGGDRVRHRHMLSCHMLHCRHCGLLQSGNHSLGPLRKVVTIFFFPIVGPTNYLTPSPRIVARVPLVLETLFFRLSKTSQHIFSQVEPCSVEGGWTTAGPPQQQGH
jgi:hypothetical protein